MKKVIMLVVVITMFIALAVSTVVEVTAEDYEPEILRKAKLVVEQINGLKSNEEEIEEIDVEYEVTISIEKIEK